MWKEGRAGGRRDWEALAQHDGVPLMDRRTGREEAAGTKQQRRGASLSPRPAQAPYLLQRMEAGGYLSPGQGPGGSGSRSRGLRLWGCPAASRHLHLQLHSGVG